MMEDYSGLGGAASAQNHNQQNYDPSAFQSVDGIGQDEAAIARAIEESLKNSANQPSAN